MDWRNQFDDLWLLWVKALIWYSTMSWLVNFQRSHLSQVSVGNISWLLHRVTGVTLAIYLVPHFISIHSSQLGQKMFDQEMNLFTSPFFKFAEFMLVVTVAFHMFNGLRIIALDCFNLAGHQKLLFGLALTGCTVILISASFLFVPQILVPAH